MEKGVEVFHLIPHLHNHHGGKEHTRADIRHLLEVSQRISCSVYLSSASIEKFELPVKRKDFLADTFAVR